MNICKIRMTKYSAVLEIKAFFSMADDVNFVESWKKMRIFYVFHIKIRIHKFISLAFFSTKICRFMEKTSRNSKLGSVFWKKGHKCQLLTPSMTSSRPTMGVGGGGATLYLLK